MNLLSVVKWVITIWMLVIAPATCQIVLRVDQPKRYGKFVEQVRNEIKDNRTTYFGIPILNANPPEKFLYIELKAPAFNMTLQLKRKDLYVVAYRDKDVQSQKFRYFYFNLTDVKPEEIFKAGVGEKIRINFKEDYASILQASNKKEIKELEFTLPKLQEVMINAYGKNTTLTDFKQRQASFLLYSILMTSEATRFKYIEQKTIHKRNSDIKVDSLVHNWEKLSEQIIRADKTGKFNQTVPIQISETKEPKVKSIKKVDDIKRDMGILLNKT